MLKHSSKAQQTKADKAQCLLLMQAIQQTASNGNVASKDGKQYLRGKRA